MTQRVKSQVLVEVCGKRIVNVMVTFLRVSLNMVSVMDMEDIFSKMETIILGNLKMTIMKDKESLSNLTEK